MLVIRLSRTGGKKKPYYRIVVLEKSVARDGRSLEILGTYNPVPNPAKIELNRERVQHWIGRGAQVSDTVQNLLRRHDQRQSAETPAA
jgi:small subunit ribosomal protein S16